jgi:hypothetical protein
MEINPPSRQFSPGKPTSSNALADIWRATRGEEKRGILNQDVRQ